MNKTLTLLLPICWLLAACAAKPPSGSVISNCPPGQTARVCPQGPDGHPDPDKRNKIRIVVSAAGVDVKPHVVCAHAGTTITATVVGVPTNAKVATVPKDGDDGWILSMRTGEGTMSIDVPPSTPDGYYGYSAISSTGKCQDPKIHVD